MEEIAQWMKTFQETSHVVVQKDSLAIFVNIDKVIWNTTETLRFKAMNIYEFKFLANKPRAKSYSLQRFFVLFQRDRLCKVISAKVIAEKRVYTLRGATENQINTHVKNLACGGRRCPSPDWQIAFVSRWLKTWCCFSYETDEIWRCD